MMFWYGSGGWAWWQAGLMWVAMIGFWALLIWAVYALITGVTRRGGQPDPGWRERPGDAGRILDERLARGEIDVEEYRRLHDVLGAGEAERKRHARLLSARHLLSARQRRVHMAMTTLFLLHTSVML